MFPEIDVGGDCLMVGQGYCVIVVAADCLQKWQIEPVGPDHPSLLSLQIIMGYVHHKVRFRSYIFLMEDIIVDDWLKTFPTSVRISWVG